MYPIFPYILPYGIHYLTEHMGQASCTMIVIPARPCFHWDLDEPSCLGGCTSAPWLGGLLQVHAVVQGGGEVGNPSLHPDSSPFHLCDPLDFEQQGIRCRIRL